MKALFLFLLTIWCFYASAQLTVETIYYIPTRLEKTEYKFPKVTSTKHPYAADSINETLAADFLWTSYSDIPDSLFKEVSNPEMVKTYDISFDVSINTKALLSIAISGEGCGAYCEY